MYGRGTKKQSENLAGQHRRNTRTTGDGLRGTAHLAASEGCTIQFSNAPIPFAVMSG